MPPRRFFIEPADIKENIATLRAPEARHLSSVLRLKPENEIRLFDGTGKVYQARITAISKTEVTAEIITQEEYIPPTPHLHLGQALLKGKKMDFIVQKATELGVASIAPFISEHCEVKRISKTHESRWQRVSLEACKQCNRPIPLACSAVYDFKSFIAASSHHESKLIFWEKEATTSVKDLRLDRLQINSIMIAIGPEGGFSDNEISLAKEAGFQSVSLGKRIMRAETATLSTMAILQFLLGNLDLE